MNIDLTLIQSAQNIGIGSMVHTVNATLHRYRYAAEHNNEADFQKYGDILRDLVRRAGNASTCRHSKTKTITALGWTWKSCLDCWHTQDEVKEKP